MTYSDAEQYWIWLSSVDGIGVKRFERLIEIFGDAKTVWDNIGCEEMRFLGPKTLESLRKAKSEEYFYRMFNCLERDDLKAITRLNPEYPYLLTEIYDPPATLYVRGECPLDDEKMFAVVGSRRCTRDGQRAAREISRQLAEQDVIVVSGLARGTDTCAHQGAVSAFGRTIAVLGCGLDIMYPPENGPLAEEILEKGGAIISEYPPKTPPNPGNFPQRNRIISGLTKGTLIVEGAKGSGAMITVNLATEQNREVFAVPGSIYSPLSEMPNRLIQDGAQVVLDGWDILEAMHWGTRPEKAAEQKKTVELDDTEKTVVEPLLEQELSFEELTRLTEMQPSKLNALLTVLELKGIVQKAPGGLYRAYL